MGKQVKRIGLLDHLGGGNLGDDATLDAVLQNIRKRWPDAAISAFSMNPVDTQSRHAIPAYAIRTRTWSLGNKAVNDTSTFRNRVKSTVGRSTIAFWTLKVLHLVAFRIPAGLIRELLFLARSFRLLRSFDILIISGGGQLTESWYGSWGFPYTIFKWLLLAKFAGAKRLVLNVGAGPLAGTLSKFFVRRALSLANYVSFRDQQSRALVQRIGYKDSAFVFPDCVYGLDVHSPTAPSRVASETLTVGIAPMPYCDPRIYHDKDIVVYNTYIHTLAQFGSWLTRHKHQVVLFCSDIGIDPLAIEDLHVQLLTHPGTTKAPSTPCITTTTDLLSTMSSMDYIVTCRFHGVVFAHLLNIPVLALSHHPKVSTLMNDLGLSHYCLDISAITADELAERFISLVSNRDEIKMRMAEKATCYETELSQQFDVLFPPRCC